MIFKVLIFAFLVSYATSRTAKEFRQLPDSALRLSQAVYPSYNIFEPDGPGTYAFGYEIDDPATGNVQFRDEERLRTGVVRGSYGVLLPDNTLHITRYVADQYGYRANSETIRRQDTGPQKLEVQVQPTLIASKPYPLKSQQQEHTIQLNSPTTTPTPDYPQTIKTTIDPTVASAVYQNHRVNLNPTYSYLRDKNVIDPQVVNAILAQPYYNQYPYYGVRQNSDGTVSTYSAPSSSQNRPPFFNWFGTNNNNYQNDPQQGPILGFLSNLVQNNPISNFFGGNQQQNDQPQNPFQSFISNLNPFNFFSNQNNRPPQVTVSLPIQSDYVPSMSSPGSVFSGNLDNAAFTNDHFLNPLTQGSPYQGYQNYPVQSVNQGYGNPTPLYNANYNPNYVNSYSTTNRPLHYSSSTSVPGYNQVYYQSTPSTYPIYQNPYQTTSPIAIAMNPYNRKKNSKNGKKKNKNKVDLPETDSDWFHDFLDKRKEASLEMSSKRPAKKSSDEENDSDFDDYFR